MVAVSTTTALVAATGAVGDGVAVSVVVGATTAGVVAVAVTGAVVVVATGATTADFG